MSKIIAFDVETPNRKNDRICSIGLSVIDNGVIADSLYFLVNPECEFDSFNIGIHGIFPEDVANAPTFDIVWEAIGDLFRENLVAAHNAEFDLNVLKKVLAYYNKSEQYINYICTLKLSKDVINNVCDYKLSTLCNHFGITLKHHNAASDSEACANILCKYLSVGIDPQQYIKKYNLFIENSHNKSSYRKISENSNALLQLKKIIEVITCDNILTVEEVIRLENWMESNSALRGNYPYDNIFCILYNALSDGILDKHELDEMLLLFKKLSDPLCDCGCSFDDIALYNKNVCLTGEFEYGSKSEISERLIKLGAIMQENVTQKTDYLIVGGEGSSAWCAGTYGTKVKKALEMQDKGLNIVIIREADFFSVL